MHKELYFQVLSLRSHESNNSVLRYIVTPLCRDVRLSSVLYHMRMRGAERKWTAQRYIAAAFLVETFQWDGLI
jgi:hypothetical protein